MAYKDKDEFLDALYDHVFPEDGGEPDKDDEEWFEHLSKFFDFLDEKSGDGGTGTNPPRRRRSGGTGTTHRRRRTASGGHGMSTAFFGPSK